MLFPPPKLHEYQEM